MIDLYTWPTPNGHKVHIMLEECGLAYNVHAIDIGSGDQFKSDFLMISPNNKMPAMVDQDGPGGKPISIFESGAILQYLGEKTGKFFPAEPRKRYDVLQWLMFQMGGIGPMLGQAHHFRGYAPEKIQYAIDRFAMETKRQLDVLDRQLAENHYIAGDAYTIADMAIWPWYGAITSGNSYANSEVFLEGASYTNVVRWEREVAERPAVKRGRRVNLNGEGKIRERHDASDLDD